MAGKRLQNYSEKFKLTPVEIDRISEMINEELKSLALERKTITRLRLAVEDVLLRWLEQLGEETPCTVKMGQRFGKPYIKIRGRGIRAQSMEETQEEYGSFLYSSLLTQACLSFGVDYKDGENRILINPVPKAKVSKVWLILTSVLLAVLSGLLVNQLPTEAKTIIAGIANPLLDTILGALRAIASPMIFLAICWGIVSIGDVGTLGRIGRKVISRLIVFTYVILGTSAVLVLGLFRTGGTFNSRGTAALFQIYEMILDIIPDNMVAPFMEGNALQIICFGIGVGIALLVLGEKVSATMAIVDQMNAVVQFLMRVIGKTVPLFVFLSVFTIVMSDSLKNLQNMVKVIVLVALFALLWPLLYAMVLARKYKIPVRTVIKKMMPTFLIAVTTASSAAAFDTNMETCEKELGIPAKISNFAVPLGQVIFMPIGAIEFMINAMFMAGIYGVDITLPWMFICIIVCGLLSIATPPIPGGALTCFTVLFAQLGIPAEAIALSMAADVLLDFLITASDLCCLQAELTLTTEKLCMLDVQKIKNKNA